VRRASEVLGERGVANGLADAELLEAEALLAALERRPADAIAAWATLDALGESKALGDPVIRARAKNGLAEGWLALGRLERAAAQIEGQPESCRERLGAMHRVCIDAFDLRARVALAGGALERARADARVAATLADAGLAEADPRRAELHDALVALE
jgi:hypothetical protein